MRRWFCGVVHMAPVAIGVLGELIATAITAAAGKSWKAIKSSSEAKTVRCAIDQVLADAFADAYRGPVTADDDDGPATDAQLHAPVGVAVPPAAGS